MTTEPIHFILVDDKEQNLTALEALLKRDNLVLLKAKSGREALEMLLVHDVALALIDVQMPEMNGYELAELMRGLERTRHVPIIFITAGDNDKQWRFRGYEAGAVDFIHKPIEADILRSKADVFFELFRQRQHVSHLLAESQQYAAALQEADKRKDEFLATLAHELRNPLSPILAGLDILSMSPDLEVASETRDMMTRQVKHMVRLIDDLLDMSRITQGKIELRLERITLQSAIHSAIEASQSTIDLARHTLTLDVPPSPVWMKADATRLSQIIGNLLNNATKYTPDGGRIRLTARSENGQAIVTVSDTGIGIASDMLQKVFELFTQVKSGSQGGLGIGLALVKQLTEMHGGTIAAASEGSGKGASFTIRLPLGVHATDSPPVEPVTAESESRGLKVLVVDDNRDSATTIGRLLEITGHMAYLAHDGRGAINAANIFHPDVIMLDIGLPDMTGYEVCKTLRPKADFANTVFIAQTGWGQPRDRERSAEAGFDHHVTKPVDLHTFNAMINEIVAKRNQSQAN